MPEPSQASTLVTMVAFLLSLIAIFVAAQRIYCGKSLLTYEPRQRVPWGAWAALIPLFCVLLPVMQWVDSLFAQQSDTLDESKVPFNLSDFMRDGIFTSVSMIGFAFGTMLWLALFLHANARDLGLPRQARQLALDIGIGCVGCLIAMLPIYLLHYLLTIVFEPQQQHELIEQLQQQRSPQMMLVGIAMAVFAAPLFEETVFRLLLQGCLERYEDQLIGFHPSERESLDPQPPTELPFSTDLLKQEMVSEADESEDTFGEDEPSRRGMIFNLPHGWAPVLISGTAFGLAHLGHGVSALPMVLFGIVLGYLYQRTHRLAPSIAAHMLFNAFTMLLLWLQLNSPLQ